MSKQTEVKIPMLKVPEDTQSIRYVLSLLLFFGIEQINVYTMTLICRYPYSGVQSELATSSRVSGVSG